ncbi:MAG: hypothetical protein LBR47_05960, partial [Spirochaetaceae bacterium]|nr:hypothetical protein [Spirochaetaceae bacterium]
TSGEVDADGTVKGSSGVWTVSDPAGKQRISVLSGQTAVAAQGGISAPQTQAVIQSMAVLAPEGIAAAEAAGIGSVSMTTAALPARESSTQRNPPQQSQTPNLVPNEPGPNNPNSPNNPRYPPGQGPAGP